MFSSSGWGRKILSLCHRLPHRSGQRVRPVPTTLVSHSERRCRRYTVYSLCSFVGKRFSFYLRLNFGERYLSDSHEVFVLETMNYMNSSFILIIFSDRYAKVFSTLLVWTKIRMTHHFRDCYVHFIRVSDTFHLSSPTSVPGTLSFLLSQPTYHRELQRKTE